MDKVRETLSKLLSTVKDKWSNFGRGIRIGIIAGIGSVVLALIIVIVISNQREYVILFTGQTSAETTEITNIMQNQLGINEWRIEGNTIKIAPELEADARWQLALLNYPKSTFGYSQFNNNVGMFSTELEMKEYLRQNLEMNLKATLEAIDEVETATVIVSIDKQPSTVISDYQTKSSVSAMLRFKPGKSLTSEQIEGAYRYIEMSHSSFSRDNITLTDGSMAPLVPSDASSGEKELSYKQSEMQMYYNFKNQLEESMKVGIEELLTPIIKKFSVRVATEIDWGTTVSESVVYTPSIDEAGTRGGMVSDETDSIAWGGMTAEGGLVGTATDADISPDYPTLIADADQEVYYEKLREVNYKVNQTVSQYSGEPFTVKKITAAIFLDSNSMTQQEIEQWEKTLSKALATSVDLVTVQPTTFLLDSGSSIGEGTLPVNYTNRNMLIFIIISLGALLVVLCFLAILTASSKKKRLVRSRLAHAAGYGGVGGANPAYSASGEYDANLFGGVTAQKVGDVEESEGFKLQSLLGNMETETREGALKAEIREFTKSNPEIVAQLIRTWMKETV